MKDAGQERRGDQAMTLSAHSAREGERSVCEPTLARRPKKEGGEEVGKLHESDWHGRYRIT
jgi:hypothetical protein